MKHINRVKSRRSLGKRATFSKFSKLIGFATLSCVAFSSVNILSFSAQADEPIIPNEQGTGSIAPQDISPEDVAPESAPNSAPENLPANGALDGLTEPAPNPAAAVLQQAADVAMQTEELAQRATSAADWDAVMAGWLQAIALTQSIGPDSPSRLVAQRQLRGYLQRLIEAQQRGEQASGLFGLPSLGSALLDSQLAGYVSYVATVGTPDILIVGSSRALQGIDPEVMQQTLASRGYPDIQVFNLSVNGATAQVVNFMVSELLPGVLSEPLPPVIVWGDGSRAFNEGRRDRTWDSIIASPGYRALRSQPLATASAPTNLPINTLNANTLNAASNTLNLVEIRPVGQPVTARSPLPNAATNLDALGFSAVGDSFTPQAYYQQFPQVNGRYDGAYSPFELYGAQTTALATLAEFTQSHNSQLIFVNLPLSSSYLDDYRLYYEQQFQQFLQAQGQALGFEVVDMLTQWGSQSALFADPSHINQDGAAAIARQLAQHPKVLTALNHQAVEVGATEAVEALETGTPF
jgi:hypothetical protein